MGADFSRVACRLETGRTHQIRVHLQHLGYPLLGDPHYGAAPAFLDQIAADARLTSVGETWLGRIPTRQALHAASLRFLHPTTGAQMRFSAELPPDLMVLSDVLQGLAVG